MQHHRRRHARGTRRQGVRRDVETLRAVGELVAAAWHRHGGAGQVTAVRLRGGCQRENRQTMNVYISGKITGIEDEAGILFAEAAQRIREAGHTPLDPFAMVDQRPGREYGELLAEAMTILLTQADAIYFLDNWGQSNGAKIEAFTAATLGIRTIELD